LHRAKQDILAGRYDLTAKPPFTADAVFHAQQAAEKSLKGLLASRDIPFGKRHNVTCDRPTDRPVIPAVRRCHAELESPAAPRRSS